jgi:hypothetical protein
MGTTSIFEGTDAGNEGVDPHHFGEVHQVFVLHTKFAVLLRYW